MDLLDEELDIKETKKESRKIILDTDALNEEFTYLRDKREEKEQKEKMKG